MDNFSTIQSSHVSSNSHSLCEASSTVLLAKKCHLLYHLRRFLLVLLRLFLHFAFLFFPPILAILSSLVPPPTLSSTASNTATSRALVHVLTLLSRGITASRKRELIRTLAEHLLDDNLVFNLKSVNHIALVEVFSRALGLLEDAVEAEALGERSSVVTVALRYGMKRWVTEGGVEGRLGAEEVAREIMWIAQKMAECGAVAEAVVMWGGAERLGRLAVSAESRLQMALVRLSVFLFKYANKVIVDGNEANIVADQRVRLSILKSWLPLLCRASNGVVASVVGDTTERGEMVRVLEEMIEKLSHEEQEEVLSIWIQQFTVCADSDWPNLQSCYTRWYTHSREILLLE